ncbi:hypothetical protein ABK040_013757 [Willaertia magna]
MQQQVLLDNAIVWLDMEMTGLNVFEDKILEIAIIITDSNLKEIDTLELIIHQPNEVLENMNDWCKEHHGKSGLTQKVKESTTSIEQAEEIILNLLKKYISPKTAPLGGNSVYMDRMFMKRELKKVDDYLHYRIIDVSSIKELARRWSPKVFEMVQKKNNHRALDDIRETLSELTIYKENLLKL